MVTSARVGKRETGIERRDSISTASTCKWEMLGFGGELNYLAGRINSVAVHPQAHPLNHLRGLPQ